MNELVIKDEAPAAMIQAAIQMGTDLDKLEKLLELQERYDRRQAEKAYYKAMAAFKENPPEIDKDKKVEFQVGNRTTSYSHASLANVVRKIGAELSKYGLTASWRTQQNGKIVVTCRISHELGHWEETSLSADADTTGSKNNIQALGSTITYLERYTLLALTGLATHDQDDDGGSAVEFITEKQLSQIVDMIADTEADEAKFLKFIGAVSVETIPASKFNQAIAALSAKAKAKKNDNS